MVTTLQVVPAYAMWSSVLRVPIPQVSSYLLVMSRCCVQRVGTATQVIPNSRVSLMVNCKQRDVSEHIQNDR